MDLKSRSRCSPFCSPPFYSARRPRRGWRFDARGLPPALPSIGGVHSEPRNHRRCYRLGRDRGDRHRVEPPRRIVVATVVGAVAAQLLDIGFACLTVWLRGTTGPWDTARTIAPVALSAVPLYAPVVVLLTIAYKELSPWTLVLFFVPALAAQRLFALLQAQRHLTEGLSSANRNSKAPTSRSLPHS